jgi:glycopeptide antibiotics resistance protein
MFGLFVIFAVIAFVGSVWPFRVTPKSFEESWNQFRHLPFFRFQIRSGSDWVSNVLLFVPLGFLAAGLATSAGTAPRTTGLIRAVLWLPVLVLFSLGLEFAQYWFPPRIVNPLDVQAQLLGACLGMGAWWLMGPALMQRLDGFSQLRPAWMVVLGLLFLAQLAPMDISIAPSDLKHKIASGGVELIPFRKHPVNLPSTQLGLAGCALSAVLMGLAFVNLGDRNDRPTRSIWMNGMLLTLAVVFMEGIQVLVMSRIFSTSHLLVGLLAGWVTIACAQRREGSAAWRLDPSEWTYMKLAMGIGAWLIGAVCLCGEFWWPLEPRIERPRIVNTLRAFRNQQLGTWLRTGEYDWPTKSKLLWYAPLGFVLGWVCRQIQHDWRRRAWPLLLLALVVSVHLAMGLELGQAIFPPHAPDQTDLLLGWLFSVLGLVLGWWLTGLFLPRERSTFAASRRDPTRAHPAAASLVPASPNIPRPRTSTPPD